MLLSDSGSAEKTYVVTGGSAGNLARRHHFNSGLHSMIPSPHHEKLCSQASRAAHLHPAVGKVPAAYWAIWFQQKRSIRDRLGRMELESTQAEFRSGPETYFRIRDLHKLSNKAERVPTCESCSPCTGLVTEQLPPYGTRANRYRFMTHQSKPQTRARTTPRLDAPSQMCYGVPSRSRQVPCRHATHANQIYYLPYAAFLAKARSASADFGPGKPLRTPQDLFRCIMNVSS